MTEQRHSGKYELKFISRIAAALGDSWVFSDICRKEGRILGYERARVCGALIPQNAGAYHGNSQRA